MENLTDIGTLLVSLVLVGFLTETAVEIVKNYFFKTKASQHYIFVVSIVVAFALCYALQVSLFEPDNKVAYYIGMALCGLVASRGSNYAHNFLGNVPEKGKK